MCGAVITSPLDVVKTRLQSDLYHHHTAAHVSQRNVGGIGGIVLRSCLHFVDTGRLLVYVFLC